VNQDIERLRTQVGIDPLVTAGDVTASLAPEAKPLQTFTAIKSLKDIAEKQATPDLAASLALLRQEAEKLRQSAGVLTREYGVTAEEIDNVLARVDAAAADPEAADIGAVVTSIQSILAPLQEKNLLTRADLLSAVEAPAHPAAGSRLSQQIHLTQNPKLTASVDVQTVVKDLSSYAPEQAKQSFEEGDLQAQKEALLHYLVSNERLASVLETLRKQGDADMQQRYQALTEDIQAIGESDPTGPCRTSVPDALVCVNTFLADAENAVRSKSFFSRTVGNLQDFFGIGQ
jgi:hypothetical protein